MHLKDSCVEVWTPLPPANTVYLFSRQAVEPTGSTVCLVSKGTSPHTMSYYCKILLIYHCIFHCVIVWHTIDCTASHETSPMLQSQVLAHWWPTHRTTTDLQGRPDVSQMHTNARYIHILIILSLDALELDIMISRSSFVFLFLSLVLSSHQNLLDLHLVICMLTCLQLK